MVGYSSLAGDSIYHAAAFNLTTDTITDLGTLGGTNSQAYAVSGHIAVGWSQTTGDAATHAAAFNLRTHAVTDLGTLGGDHSVAEGVSGDIAFGYSYLAGDSAYHATVFNLDTGTVTDMGTLGDKYSHCAGITGHTVVGEVFDGQGEVRPFAYDLHTGVMTDLDPAGGELFAVDGHIAVGDSGGAAAAYNLRTGAITDLGRLTPSGPSLATAISGHIAAGYAFTSLPPTSQGTPKHAVAFDVDTATITDLGTLGGSDSYAQAVSGHTVVGLANTPITGHAFAYDLNTHTMTDLGSLGGATLESAATLVTPDGLIAGWSTADDGGQYVVAWSH